MPIILETKQQSDEWFAMRRGVITGTRAQALFERGTSRAKGMIGHTNSFLKPREAAIAEIAMERLEHSGKPQATGAALRRGNDFEQEALDAYMFATGQLVEPVGFALHSDCERWGCSPDGIIGATGMIQVKVPTSVLKHVEYIKTGVQAEEYGWQVFHEMFVMDRQWSDVVSYCPEAPPGLQLAIQRLLAPRDGWKAYRAELISAESAVDDMVEILARIAA
jgi:hypothetical protein